jgi:hypothetical protein
MNIKGIVSALPFLGILCAGCMTEGPVDLSEGNMDNGGTRGVQGITFSSLPSGGEWRSGYWEGTLIRYYRLDSVNYFESDIIIPDNEIDEQPGNVKSNGITSNYWPNGGDVPYVIESSASSHTAEINAAIEHWRTRTPVVFVPRTSQIHYVAFRAWTNNSSPVGCKGGKQYINNIDFDMGIIAHEMGHCVGLNHEHSRADRDSYIEVNWANIKDDKEYNFSTTTGFTLDGFDYNSIMLYDSYISDPAFVFDPKVWVMRRKSDKWTWSAQRNALSTSDIRGVGRMYPGTAPIYLASNGDLLGNVIYTLANGISRFEVDGNRILALSSGGVLYGKDGISGVWSNLKSNVSKFWFSGDYIAALQADGNLYGKYKMNGTWQTLRGGVKDVRVAGSRFLALGTDNVLYGKDGVSGTWVTLIENVKDFRLVGNRIAALLADGTLYAKDGLSGIWCNLLSKVNAFDVNGNRIAAITTDGTLYAKDGISGTWYTLAGNVAAMQIEGNRIGSLRTDGTLYCKDGISGVWANEQSNVSAFYLSGNAIAIRVGNALYSKTGLNGLWHYYAGNCAMFEQL